VPMAVHATFAQAYPKATIKPAFAGWRGNLMWFCDESGITINRLT
jgi:hypothetical protein